MAARTPSRRSSLAPAILSGPHTFNFAETYSVLQRYRGIPGSWAEPDELAAALKIAFRESAEAAEMKRRAGAAIGTSRGRA